MTEMLKPERPLPWRKFGRVFMVFWGVASLFLLGWLVALQVEESDQGMLARLGIAPYGKELQAHDALLVEVRGLRKDVAEMSQELCMLRRDAAMRSGDVLEQITAARSACP